MPRCIGKRRGGRGRRSSQTSCGDGKGERPASSDGLVGNRTLPPGNLRARQGQAACSAPHRRTVLPAGASSCSTTSRP